MLNVRKNNFIFIFLLQVLLLMSSCTTIQKVDEEKVTYTGNVIELKIYFTKSVEPKSVILVPVKRKISKEGSIVAECMKELFLGPTKAEEARNIMTEIPTGTRLINLQESEDEILVNVSSQFLAGGGSAAMQLRYLQIYKTLKKIAPFKDIYFQVDGKNIKTIGGEGLEITQPLTMIEDYTQKYKEIKTIQP